MDDDNYQDYDDEDYLFDEDYEDFPEEDYDGQYYDIEPTWMYEWRNHFSYEKPTIKQKLYWLFNDLKYQIKKLLGHYDELPF